MYNKKALNTIIGNLDRTKAPTRKNDMIVDPMGQWKYPGQNTRIPGNDITMQGVPYPVFAQPNVGQAQMMYPGQDYQFPGADYVDEFPMARRGGAFPKLPKKKDSKAYSRSLTATNRLFAQNSLTKKSKSKKNKIFNPLSKYFQDGGEKDTIIYPPGDSEYMNQPALNYDIIEMLNQKARRDYEEYIKDRVDPTNINRASPRYQQEFIMDQGLVHAQEGKEVSTVCDDGRCEETDKVQEHLDQVADWKRQGLNNSWLVAENSFDKNNAAQEWKKLGLQDLGERLPSVEDPSRCASYGFNGLKCTPAGNLFPYSMTESNYKATSAVKKGNSNFDYVGDFNNMDELTKTLRSGDYVSLKGTDAKGKPVSHMQVYSHTREDGVPIFLDSNGDKNDFGWSAGMNRPVSNKLTGTVLRFAGDKKKIADLEKKARVNPTYINRDIGRLPLKELSPNLQQGGYIELELDDSEIEAYKKGGYVVEELPQAQDGVINAVDQATLDRFNSIPFVNKRGKHINMNKFHPIDITGYPSMTSNDRLFIPKAGTYGPDDYKEVTIPEEEGKEPYIGHPLYNPGNTNKLVSVDKDFNKKYLTMMERKRFLRKDELLPVYGQGKRYTPVEQDDLVNQQQGGFIETELTDEEIEQYRNGGYYIEELD